MRRGGKNRESDSDGGYEESALWARGLTAPGLAAAAGSTEMHTAKTHIQGSYRLY